MAKSERLVRYTAEELRAMCDRGEFQEPDWGYIDSLIEEELEASIDVEEEGMPIWDSTVTDIPKLT